MLSLASCGTSTIDSGDVAKHVTTQFKDQNIPLTDVTCADGIEQKVGSPVKCTGFNPDKTKLFIEGTVTKVDDGTARYEVKAIRGEAQGTVIATQVQALVEQQVDVAAKSMTCPETVEMPTKTALTCVLTVENGDAYDVSVMIDGNGNAEVEVADEPNE